MTLKGYTCLLTLHTCHNLSTELCPNPLRLTIIKTHNHPNITTTMFRFGKHFSEDRNKGPKLATLSKGSSAETCFLLSLPLLRSKDFCRLRIFTKFQDESSIGQLHWESSKRISIRINKPRKMRGAEHVARSESWDACKILVGKHEGKRQLGRRRRR
jgi:hypothetical protein